MVWNMCYYYPSLQIRDRSLREDVWHAQGHQNVSTLGTEPKFVGFKSSNLSCMTLVRSGLLRNQWLLGCWPGIYISHVITTTLFSLAASSPEASCLGPEVKKKGDKYSLENTSESKLSHIQEEYHKLGTFIPRNMDKYLLFLCTHSSNKYTRNTYYVPDTMLGHKEAVANKTEMVSSLAELVV